MIAQNGCAHLVITVEYIWTSRDERHPSLLFSSPLLPFYLLVTFINWKTTPFLNKVKCIEILSERMREKLLFYGKIICLVAL